MELQNNGFIARVQCAEVSVLPTSMPLRVNLLKSFIESGLAQRLKRLPSIRCGLGSIPGPGFTCDLSLLLVLILAPRVFSRVLRFPPRHEN